MVGDEIKCFPMLDDSSHASVSAIEVASRISKIGVRSKFLNGVFTALPQLRIMSYDGAEFVQIGVARMNIIAVDSRDFSVWRIFPDSTYSPVNSSYDLFDLSMEKVASMDLSAADADDIEWLNALSDSMKEVILSVDPSSMEQDTFWYDLFWDVRCGDFSK